MSHSVATDKLLAQQLMDDPRVRQAEELLQAALADAQSELEGVRGPRPELQQQYNELIDRLFAARGGATYFRYLSSGIGNGPWVELADGSVKLDFIVGIGVHGLGHSHPEMLSSSLRAALQNTIMQGNLQQHPEGIDVCELLIKLANHAEDSGLSHCLLTTSGAMANENALKIAFHNRAPADRVICLENCFAGRSIAMAQLTDRPQYRIGLPTALAVDYIPGPDAENSPAAQQRSLDALDKLLKRYPGKYATLWLELVAGEGGYYPGSSQYFSKLIERAKQDNVLIIFDEVQTFGRLSRPFAFQHFGLSQYADIVSVGKISQLCATLYGEALKPKGPLLSQTFTAATSAVSAAHVILKMMDEGDWYGSDGQNERRHHYFRTRLEQLAAKHPGKISGPWGCGMMIAFTPGDGSTDAAARMVHAMYDAGLMSFVAGSNPTRIRFLPPPAITQTQHIDAAIEIMDSVLTTFE
jgi:4-aminobutyrate aminotransferase-like enzyme